MHVVNHCDWGVQIRFVSSRYIHEWKSNEVMLVIVVVLIVVQSIVKSECKTFRIYRQILTLCKKRICFAD